MTGERSHEFIHEPELAERYVAGRMPDAERIAFEDHFVACAQCQSDLRFASAVRAGHAGAGAASRGGELALVDGSTGGRRRVAWWAGTALAAGIAAVAIIIAHAAPSPAFVALGDPGDAPVYLGIAVRSSVGRGEAIFEAAMKAYAEGRYAAANQGLQEALTAGEDSIPAEFFIGASYLFSGNANGAADAFARVIAKGDSPYADESQLYRAKALLRLGRGNDALAVLTAHAPADPAMAARLSALADSVKRAGAR